MHTYNIWVSQRVNIDCCLSPYHQCLFSFLSQTEVNTNLVRRHRHASLYLTFYSSTRWVRRMREPQQEQEKEKEREKERRDKDVKVETERWEAPGDKAVAMPKSQEDPKHTQQHTCTQSKQRRGGWWELECQNDVTEDDRILTALTARTARARQQSRPQEMGEGRRDGRHEEKMFSTSACVAALSSPPPHHAA